jgi:hypothetical protein
MTLLERDDLQESKKIESISKELVIDALSDKQKLALVLSNVNQYLASEVSFVKSRIDDVEKAADLERLDAVRKAIAKWRVDSGKNYTAMKKANKDLIAKADDGFELVVLAQKNAESEIEQALAAKKQEFEQERLRKKALADAIAKLRTHTINPLLSAADIEAAIDDFRLAFGDSNYQESQGAAEAIFESKAADFEIILAAAVAREENEAAVRLEQARSQQRANIGVTFPIAEISGYAARSASDIQSRIDWTAKVDMSVFELVAGEAETTKQSCLNMLAAFLPMAVAREAKEEADKAEAERIERERQAEIDAEVANNIASCSLAEDVDCSVDNRGCTGCDDVATKSTVIAIINDDAGFVADVAKIIGEPCFEQSNPVANGNFDDEEGCYDYDSQSRLSKSDPLYGVKKESANSLYDFLCEAMDSLGEGSVSFEVSVSIINLIANSKIPNIKFVI